MRKTHLKNSASVDIIDVFARKIAETSPETQQDAIFDVYTPDEDFALEEGEDETSNLLCRFLIDAIEIEYPLVGDCLDMQIDHDEASDVYYAFFAPKPNLSEQERVYAFKTRDQFFSEIEEMDFDPQKIGVSAGLNAIVFKQKMSLLALVVDYLKSKDIRTFNLNEVEYDTENDKPDARTKRLEDCALRATRVLQADNQYMGELMLSTPLRAYADMAGFVGNTQNLKDVFSSFAGDIEKGALSISLSNGRTLIAEKIRLENRNDYQFTSQFGQPGYFIN